MALFALLTRDLAVDWAVRDIQAGDPAVVRTASWNRLRWLVRERPVGGVILDAGALPGRRDSVSVMSELTGRFPSVAPILIARSSTRPQTLLRLGRVGLEHLVLVHLDHLRSSLAEAVRRALRHGTEGLVTRVLSPYLPAGETRALRLALTGVLWGWDAEELALQVGFTRPHLSVRLKKVGLPPTGHLLLWARLLHAGRWLDDPGRTAESTSRQLGYANGATFRRALRNHVGCTPTELRRHGAFDFVMSRFLEYCDVERDPFGRSVA